MRLISVERCPTGVRLAKSIYSASGTTLIGAGVVLTQKMLDRLRDLNITAIYVEDPDTSDIVVEDVVSEQTRREAMEAITTTFRAFQNEPDKWRQHVSDQRLGRKFKHAMSSVIDELKQSRSVMSLLGTAYGVDHYIFSHSFNVSLYTICLALKLGYNERELIDIGIGAILHDIGKTMIPLHILTKPGRLTDEEYAIVQKHTEYGFEILRKQEDISLLSAHCAFQHHEREDGSGYPRKLKKEAIHPYAKIVGLCDVFDALTSQRVYRQAMLPHQAMEVLYTGANTLFDGELVQEFRNTIALYPIGLGVRLNTGEQGVVVDYNRGVPSRPIVRVLTDPAGQKLSSPYEVDLSKQLHLMISQCDPIA